MMRGMARLWPMGKHLPGHGKKILSSQLMALDSTSFLPITHPASLWTCGTATMPHLVARRGGGCTSHLKPRTMVAPQTSLCQTRHENAHAAINKSSLLSHAGFHNLQHRIIYDSKLSVRLQSDCSKLRSFPDAGCSGNKILPSKNSSNETCSNRGLHQGLPNVEKSTKRYLNMLSAQALVEASPDHVQPYMRLMRIDRPIGTWLLYMPCMFSITLATPAGHFPDPMMLALFGLGAFLMRGAGCTINDMWDKDFDARVARTHDRPLACGDLSRFQALCFLGLQLSGALAILLTFNWYTIALGASSMLLVITYPLMKRITYWPQAFLGLTFNWGALTGWSAVQGVCDWAVVLPLYASCFAWTIVYDTIYAHQDKEDDIMIGVKSTALKFGDQTKPWLSLFTAGLVGGLTATGVMCDQHWIYYMGVAMVGTRIAHQIYTVDLDDRDDCGKTFRQTRNIALLLWIFMLAGNLLKDKPEAVEQTEGADVAVMSK